MIPSRHNILLLIVDDLRPEIRSSGKQRLITPNLDRLAAQGLQFANAYCQMAACGPSRLSTLTGFRPPSSDVTWALEDPWCASGEPTLPGHLRAHGYTTVSIGKTYHTNLDDPAGWTRRYEDTFYEASYAFDGYCSGYQLEENKALVRNMNAGLLAREKTKDRLSRHLPASMPEIELPPITECVDAPDEAYPDATIAQQASDEVHRMATEEDPWFIAAGFYRPHLPWAVPKKYWDLYDRSEVDLADNPFPPLGGIGFGDQADLLHYGDETINHTYGDLGFYDVDNFPVLDDAKQRECVHGYWASVSFVDAQLGKVLDALEESGQIDNTTIILWGDNGWHLGEHGLWSKGTNFEEATRIPLLIASPDLPASSRGQSSALVELVDLYPTICDLVGAPRPEHLEGTSLAPILHDPNRPWKAAAFSRMADAVTMRTERFRYTQYARDSYRGDRYHLPSNGSAELFDHEVDPGENENVVGDPQYEDELRKIRALFDAGWPDAVPPSVK